MSLSLQSNSTAYEMFLIDFAAGGIAGAVSRTSVSPLERLKIIFQLQDGKNKGMLGTLSRIWKTEGFVGMFKGNGTNIIRIFPYSAIQFASYELAKKKFLYTKSESSELSPMERMVSGAFAGICSVSLTYPLDIIRTRLSLPRQDKKSIIKCGKDIFMHEGGVVGLYRGLSPTLAGIAPNIALNFTVYEGMKGWFASNKDEIISVEQKLVSGGVAGAVSQTVTYPFDVIRRRMQVNNSPDSRFRYTNSFDAVFKIVKAEGISALFKGLLPNYVKVIPAISISFVTFEFVRSLIFG